MLMTFIVAAVGFAFIYGAFRIIAGWTLPAATVQRLDRGVNAAAGGTLKAVVVVVGLVFLVAIVLGLTGG